MRLNKYLNEKINLNYKLDYIKDFGDQWESTFDVDGTKFQFQAILYNADLFPTILDVISFYDENIKRLWEIEFRVTEFDYEKGGDPFIISGEMGSKAIQVFSGVATSLKKFISGEKPGVFFFSAKESSRIKLYNRMSKMIARAVSLYGLKKVQSHGESHYIFIKGH